MRKFKLKGIERAVKELNNTILITRDDFSKEYIDKNADIKIQMLKDSKAIDSITTDNLIKGLIVCSNYYLPAIELEENLKTVKTKLEKLIRKGAAVKIVKFQEDSMRLIIKVNGDNKYNFYGSTFNQILEMVEDSSKTIASNLKTINI